MKKILFAFMALTLGLLTSCGGDDEPVTEITEKTIVFDIPQNIDLVKQYVDAYNALPESMQAMGLTLLMNEVDDLRLNLKGFTIGYADGKTGPALLNGETPYLKIFMPKEFEAECKLSTENKKVRIKSVELVHHHSMGQLKGEYSILALNKGYRYSTQNDELLSSYNTNIVNVVPAPTYDPVRKSDVFDLLSSDGKFSIETVNDYTCTLELTQVVVKYDLLP